MTRRTTNKEFLEKVNKQPNSDEYSFLEKYQTADTHISIMHKKCGHIYKVSPSKYFNGRRCPECAKTIRGNKKRLTHKEFLKRINEIHGSEIEILSNFTLTRDRIKVKHKLCGMEYEMVANKLLSGHKCFHCYGFKTITETEFRDRLYNETKDEYIFKGIYTKSIKKMKVIHRECGNEFMSSPHNFFNGSRCPYCSSSKGELAIAKILDNLKIDYNKEHTFADCVDKRMLPFDFYLPNLNIVIEYDGKQHYKPIDFFGGKKEFEKRVKRDRIKDNYCYSKNIKIIRIPYWIHEYKKHDMKVFLIKAMND